MAQLEAQLRASQADTRRMAAAIEASEAEMGAMRASEAAARRREDAAGAELAAARLQVGRWDARGRGAGEERASLTQAVESCPGDWNPLLSHIKTSSAITPLALPPAF